MSGGEHELVLASAGSGKTFRISSRILTLLATGVEPDALFASTFTRKAAGEILARVLERLSTAAHSDAGAADLGRELAELSEREELAGLGREEWQVVLARTMRSLHRFDVSTLDAFFGRAVRSFAHELGLPAGWRIADEATADRLRSLALEEVLAELDTGAMVELVRGMTGGEVRRSVHEGLARDADAILRIHRELDSAGPGWDALGRELGLIRSDDEPDEAARAAEVGRVSAALATLPLPTTKAGSPRAVWVKARDGILEALGREDWEAILDNTLVQRAGEAEPKYAGAPLEPPFLEAIDEILALARRAVGRAYHRRAQSMKRLAEGYDRILDETLRAAGTLRFDDVTRLLAGPDSPGGREDLGYRLDAGIRHLLLDEFQDTSLLQWRALGPLIDRLVAAERSGTSSSVVADPKQSIYGWRGAAPVIVDAFAETYRPHTATLSRSWRSSRLVLDTVNRVFQGIADNPVLTEDDTDQETARAWAAHFEPHTPARDGLPGHVTLEVGSPKEGRSDLQPALLRFAAERVAALHRADPARSIGVLMRKNESVARMIFELKESGVEASEEGGTRLTDSPAVVSVLALLRLADHPGNRLARYHVARTPVGPVVEYTDPADDRGAAYVSLRIRERLVEDGYGATLSWLRDRLRGDCTARDLHRLDQMVELGHAHDEIAGLRVDDFVTVAERTRVEAAGGAPVRVMTVWGSKGLEFDAVVLPDLHLPMRGRGFGGPPLAWRPEPTALVQHAFPPMKAAVRDLLTPVVPTVAEAWGQARAAETRDALSGIYVAMTRARYALHMIIPAEPEKVSQTRSPARLLRHALDRDPESLTAEREVRYEVGEPDWWRTAPRKESGDGGAEATGAPPELSLAPRPHRRLLDRRKPSEHEVELDRLLGLSSRDAGGADAALRGRLVHAWMEAVRWLEDGLPDRKARLELARREAPEYTTAQGEEGLEELWSWMEDRLDTPEVRAALTAAGSREAAQALLGASEAPGDETFLEVENELPFLHREGDTLMEGIIDRLVLVRAGKPDDAGVEGVSPSGTGAVLAAHILDYKTDFVPAGDETALRERSEHYLPQLRAYRGAVAALYGIPTDRVRCTLLFLEAGRAVDVD